MPRRRTKQPQDVISRLAHTGEEALQKLADLPGGSRFLEAANALRDRVDDLARRVRQLDPLERRVAELERRLDELSKPAPRPRKPAAQRSSRARTSRSRRPPAAG
jgi:predicted transcriptional regulator